MQLFGGWRLAGRGRFNPCNHLELSDNPRRVVGLHVRPSPSDQPREQQHTRVLHPPHRVVDHRIDFFLDGETYPNATGTLICCTDPTHFDSVPIGNGRGPHADSRWPVSALASEAGKLAEVQVKLGPQRVVQVEWLVQLQPGKRRTGGVDLQTPTQLRKQRADIGIATELVAAGALRNGRFQKRTAPKRMSSWKSACTYTFPRVIGTTFIGMSFEASCFTLIAACSEQTMGRIRVLRHALEWLRIARDAAVPTAHLAIRCVEFDLAVQPHLAKHVAVLE